jgi:hypothetical protein
MGELGSLSSQSYHAFFFRPPQILTAGKDTSRTHARKRIMPKTAQKEANQGGYMEIRKNLSFLYVLPVFLLKKIIPCPLGIIWNHAELSPGPPK